jgi:hypothetical protein
MIGGIEVRSPKQAGLIALFAFALVVAPVCASACAGLTCSPPPAEAATEHHHGAPAPDDSDSPSHGDCCGRAAAAAVLAPRVALNTALAALVSVPVAVAPAALPEFDSLHAARVRDHSPPRFSDVFVDSIAPLRV